MFAEDEARLLIQEASDDAELERLARRRLAGEPLELVLGWAELAGVRVHVGPGVFVPRQRSALLVERAAAALDGLDRPCVLVDLCCGTGALGLAVADRVTDVELHAADIDPVACACARLNLQGVGTVHEGDLFAPLPADLRGRIDVLLVNAPYVPTDAVAAMPREAREHEPRVSLDGGTDGVAFHRRVARAADAWLGRGATVLVETSARQAGLTAGAFDAALWDVRECRDEERDATAIQATRR